MTTLNEMIEIIKAENPTLRVGNDESGYTELNSAEYNETIKQWAEARLEKETKRQAEQENRQLKISAYEKLGLTKAEIEALLPPSQY